MISLNGKKFGFAVSLFVVMLMSSIMLNANVSKSQQILPDGAIKAIIPIGAYQINNTTQGQEISVENFGRLLVPGKPNLPSKIFAIAIPPGTKVDAVSFDMGEGIGLTGTYQIPPSPLPRVIGQEDPRIYQQEKKKYDENFQSIYSIDQPYPASVGEVVGTAGFRKYNLVDVRITPFSYRPKSGQLTYYPQITVNVKYTTSQGFPMEIVADNLPREEKVAQEIILNYDQAKGWYPNSIGGKGIYDFVIITTAALTSSVTPLVNWEIGKGKTVNVVTTTWISSNYTGYDLAEKIRNFLRDKYPSSQWGIEDVLLVGNHTDVPMRRCWQDVGYGKPETDFYYAELSLPDSLSWDIDKDHKWGEDSPDQVDFYAEVNVGRIPWSVPATVLHICEKSVAYEQNDDPAFKKNILLLGAFFWDNDPNPRTDNAVLMEAKINQFWMADWTKTRMYEQGYSTYPMNYNLTYNNVRSVWSTNHFAFVNWAGHGSEFGSYIYHTTGEAFVSTSTCPNLNDNYPAICFADACSNSDTDYPSGNLGQMMLQQGAVGFVGATKVALGCPGWINVNSGSSQSLDYLFTTKVTSYGLNQGAALQWALIYMYTHGLWDYNKYETFEWGALWGNPDLGMAPIVTNYPPLTPQQPSGITEGGIEIEYDFSTVTTDPDGDDIFYLFSWGDGTDSIWHGPFLPGNTCTIPHSWNNPGTYYVKVKAKDTFNHESAWSDSLFIARFTRGDCNGDKAINVEDVVYLINYLYKGGPAPYPFEAGDTNCDKSIAIGDVVYLINYLFRSGTAPGC